MTAPPQFCRWHPYSTPDAMQQAAAQHILRSAQNSRRRTGRFLIALAGGNTPRRIYEMLRGAETDWSCWHVYFGDERCLPPEHPERNSRMAAEALLDHVAIPRGQIHVIPAELGADAAAAAYARTLSGTDEFDLVLLGLGEDGHTASLFPGHEWGARSNAPAAIAVHDAPKPPPDRVSLSAARLGNAREVMFLVSGATKNRAVSDWRRGRPLPACAVAPAAGVDVFIESALLASPS